MTFNCDLDLESACLSYGVLHITLLRQTFDQNFMKIFQRVQEIQSKRKRWMTFNCDLDLESASLSYGFCTSSH